MLIAPLFLRLTIGITLLWTGMGLVSATFSPTSSELEALRAMKAVREQSPASDGPITPAPTQQPQIDTSKPDPTGPEPGGTPPALLALQSQLPQAGPVPRVYRIALQSMRVATPESTPNSQPPSLWPAFAVVGEWPKFIAWSVAVGSVVAGSMFIAGLFVRLCGFAGALLIGVPFWLFLIAPAIQSDTVRYGFIPGGGMWDLDAAGQLVHMPFMWNVLQIGACLTLLFSGAGYLSLDRALFTSGAGGPPARKAQPKRSSKDKE
jgi:uncharacterized membrane protein YphA (DoxX/SURF4 family)